MVRASTLPSVDLGFISQVESYQKTLKMVFTAFLLGAQQNKNGVENKLASLLVVSLGKTLKRDASIFRWQTDGGVKQSTRRSGPSLTEDLKTDCEC